MRVSLCLAMALGLSACGNDGGGKGGDDSPDGGVVVPASDDPLEGLPTGNAQWQALCAKGYHDLITAKFCANTTPPTLTSLKDLQQLLGLQFLPNPNNDPNINANVRITLTGLSTGLGIRGVTPLNPRAFLMTTPNATAPNGAYQAMAFSRGEPFVELVANDPNAQTLRFFLVRFKPACEATGCSFGDFLGPGIESNWVDYTIYDDATIGNTTVDCLNCHQPGGPNTRKILRMQELANPWAHWFYIEHQPNASTMTDYHNAHGTEDYAGIPDAAINPSRPINLQRLVTNNGFGTQPNQFDTTKIEQEMVASGQSTTWNNLYAQAVAGREIPPPYFTTAVDPTKVAAMVTAYQQMRAGTLPVSQLPDIRDTFLDSALADMSIRPKAGLDGRGILTHMCRMCHNSQLDQTISRAAFDIDRLDQLSRAEKDEAIKRLSLPTSDRHHMPPARFHELSDAERDLVIQELSK